MLCFVGTITPLSVLPSSPGPLVPGILSGVGYLFRHSCPRASEVRGAGILPAGWHRACEDTRVAWPTMKAVCLSDPSWRPRGEEGAPYNPSLPGDVTQGTCLVGEPLAPSFHSDTEPTKCSQRRTDKSCLFRVRVLAATQRQAV